MNQNEFLAKTVDRQLAGGKPLVLVSIMSFEGSTPRHSGTKMVIGADGTSYGTIGGSLIESEAVREARDVLATSRSRIVSHELCGEDASAPGMICGGKAELLLDYLAPSPENQEFARRWREALDRGRDFFILTHMQGAGESFRVAGHAVLVPRGETYSGASLSAGDIERLRSELHDISASAIVPLSDSRVLVDRIRRQKTLYCFGAGHVAAPTAHLAALAGFRVVVLDDRPDYASAERFPEAQELRVVGDFRRAFEGLEIDGDSFIVIVTHGHRYDRFVLGQALKTPAGYIGMIGSRSKRDAIYGALTAAGVMKESLARVHSPIGLDIGGETPEEIAISIVAELIGVRNGKSI